MPNKTPVAASRFSISVDGVEVASFSELQGISTKVDVTPRTTPRKLLAHELTHAVQKTVGYGPVAVRVKTADIGKSAAQKLRSAVGRMLILTATNARGGVASRFRGRLIAPERSANAETVTIVCDHLQRVAV
ncbi:hypothetical protein BDE40_2532 [Litoreibacter halocynthiae]|uniref:DUF4157 domain-containing protein n=1 Tax=Litoreibacter halocynthiae TaxID=1242689 RepID=A0A4R7LDT8_9RHOB|nr:hypothetical protein [Litoreibacter halocynthiae]TDT73757.1 hypothetical protein BDE40_2532 [Litoreibacter halocynthiae]